MQNITHHRGDTFEYPIEITWDDTGLPINISGSTLTFSVKKNISDATYIVQEDATITDAAQGEAKFEVSDTIMKIAVGNYHYDIQWRDSLGVVTTIENGILTISYEVT